MTIALYYFGLSFFVYGILGWCTEVAYATVKTGVFENRGFLSGPICPIYGIAVALVVDTVGKLADNIILLFIGSLILVTLIELIGGFVLDKAFHARWWDYTMRKGNIGGYICPLFSFIWGVSCVVVVKFVHPLFMDLFYLIPTFIGWAIIIVGLVCIIADAYMVAVTILKANKRIAALEKIATDLHELSERMGGDIYMKTLDAMERKEELDETVMATEMGLRKDIRAGARSIADGLAEGRDAVDNKIEDLKFEFDERIEGLKARRGELGADIEGRKFTRGILRRAEFHKDK